MDIFAHNFMIKAMIIGVILSIIIPAIGIVVVNKRISIIGDALSHTSLAGVVIGLFAGITPIVGSIIACIAGSLFIEFIGKKFPGYRDLSTAIVMSTGVGLASLFSGFLKTSANFEAFLFGSIVAITDFEFYFTIIIGIVVIIAYILMYKELMYLSFDEEGARISGVKVDMINVIFMILIAFTISVSSRTVGVLIISSLMVIPSACSLQFKKGYKDTIILSSLFGLLFTISGLTLSYYFDLKPGGTIVLIGVATLLFIIFLKRK